MIVLLSSNHRLADGRLVARIMGAVARKESDDKSRRIRRKHLELAERGLAHGGVRPYGYAFHRHGAGTQLVVVAHEAEIIVEMASRVLAGESLRALSTDLNGRGLAGSQGRPFSSQAIRRILLSGRIAGLREHRGDIVNDTAWEPIVDRVTFERLRALLTHPARRTTRPARRYLLTGLIRCGVCGALMKCHPTRRRGYSYDCAPRPGKRGCGRISVTGAPLEHLVVEAVCRLVDSPTLPERLACRGGAGATAALEEIHAGEAKLEQLAEAWANDDITRAEWIVARQVAERRLCQARKPLADLRSWETLAPWFGRPGELAGSWSELAFPQQRAVVSALVERVVVGPVLRVGARFDAKRVGLLWRM